MRTAALFALLPILTFAQPPQARVPLTPAARQAAELIGVAPLIERLETLPAPAADPEALALRQRILEAVVSASLEVDSATAAIRNEWGSVFGLAARFRIQRDRDVQRFTLAGAIIGIGGGIVSSAMQLSTATEKPGNIIGVAAGAAASAVFGLGLRAQKGPEYRVRIAPAMLAPIFGRLAEAGAEYPPVVWAFLNAPVAEGPGSQVTRREMLIRQWAAEGRFDPADPLKEREKIGILTNPAQGGKRLSLDDLEDRMAMLNDVITRISLLKSDLSAIMSSLRTLGE